MSDLSKYNTSSAWFTIAQSVYQIDRETPLTAATYGIKVNAIDTNNIGANLKDADYAFTDFVGVPYLVISTGVGTILVSDVFKQGCPTSGKMGIVHKSAYKGYSILLPTELLYRLHPIAVSNNNKFSMSVLWGNDPNGRRIEFTDVYSPEISNYRESLEDSNNVSFNPMQDYGQNPQFEVWQFVEAGKYSRLPIDPQLTLSSIDGLIDSVLFSGTGELISGYILIKN